jgi:hypothetical protein
MADSAVAAIREAVSRPANPISIVEVGTMEAPGDKVASFNYSGAEWAEIEAAAQSARKGPLRKEVAELLRTAAGDYLAETTAPPAYTARALNKKWLKLAAHSERLHQEFFACEEETLREMKRKGHLTGEEKLRMEWLNNIRWHLKLAPVIAKTTANYFYDQDDKSNRRVRYQSKVLEVWVQLGGKLQISRHPKTQEIRGPLARFFFAVLRPVMGSSTPAPDSLRDIVKRQKKTMGEIEVIPEQPRGYLLGWYDRLCEQQGRKLAIELDVTRALVGPDDPAILGAERHAIKWGTRRGS